MTDRALVLGGGGPVGIAWETGVLAGLADAGVAVAETDFILGTSAGSFVGAQIALEWPLEKMLKAQIAVGEAEAAGASKAPAFDPTPFIQLVAKMPADQEPSLALRQEFGAQALAAQTMPLDTYFTSFAALAKTAAPWPARYGCTAVNAATGAFHVFRAADGVALAHAVAASCAVPAIFPAVPLNGADWIDGGVRSATSLDAAAGLRRVLGLAVVTPLSGPIIAGQLARETAAIEAAGGAALVLAPDAASLGVFPKNLMSPGKSRAAIAEAGFAQGRAEAARVGDFLR